MTETGCTPDTANDEWGWISQPSVHTTPLLDTTLSSGNADNESPREWKRMKEGTWTTVAKNPNRNGCVHASELRRWKRAHKWYVNKEEGVTSHSVPSRIADERNTRSTRMKGIATYFNALPGTHIAGCGSKAHSSIVHTSNSDSAAIERTVYWIGQKG